MPGIGPGSVSFHRAAKARMRSAWSGKRAISSAEVSANGRPAIMLEVPLAGDDVVRNQSSSSGSAMIFS